MITKQHLESLIEREESGRPVVSLFLDMSVNSNNKRTHQVYLNQKRAQFEELLAYFPSPGVLNERMWIFVAKGLTTGPPAREANEEIENLVISWDEALAMLDSRDGKSHRMFRCDGCEQITWREERT